jgi:hypothetical protein
VLIAAQGIAVLYLAQPLFAIIYTRQRMPCGEHICRLFYLQRKQNNLFDQKLFKLSEGCPAASKEKP